MPVHPGPTSTFIHSHEASGKLIVEFARNPKDFPLNQYAQIQTSPKPAGYYLVMTAEQAARVINADLREFLWAPGNEAPDGSWNLETFDFLPFECKRYAYPFRMDMETARNASWDIVAQHARYAAQQAMTARTVATLNVLTTSANWPASHVLSVPTIPGNSSTRWDGATVANQVIRNSLTYAAELILTDTLGVVRAQDLRLVVSSELARIMARTQEIVDYIKGSPFALAQLRGELPGRNVIYGLPDTLYGIEVVVEDTKRVTTLKGAATTTRQNALANNQALLVSRPGALVAPSGSASFSTVTIFVREGWEMRVETKEDAWNQLVFGRVVDFFDVRLTAPASGVLFTNCIT